VPRPAFVPLARLPAERLWATDSGLNQDFILRPVSGASFEAVEAEIDAMLDGLVAAGTLVPRRDDPDGSTARVHPGLNVPPLMRPMVRTAVGVLSLAALLILIIPCANVANLLVVRALDARGQMAIRRALGASRGRIVGQALTESLVLALLGAAAGVGVSLAIGTTLQGETLWGLPPLEGFLVDRRVWTFRLVALVRTALLSGALPAAVAARFAPPAAPAAAGDRTTGRHPVVRHGSSTVQSAVALPLLVGRALLVRTVFRGYAVGSGLEASNVHVASMNEWRSGPIALG